MQPFRFIMRVLLPLVLVGAVADDVAKTSVLVFGDSFGQTGPTWAVVEDAFARHQVPATVKSTAVGGTTACQWAGTDWGNWLPMIGAGPNALVDAAKRMFPDLPDGPDHVWYTLGADDMAFNKSMHRCANAAKGYGEVMRCVDDANQRILNCTATLLDNYFRVFPKSRVLQPGYDVPCYSEFCLHTFDRNYWGVFCEFNTTCMSEIAFDWITMHLRDVSRRYAAQPHYTSLNLVGTVQKAAGMRDADVGKPLLSAGARCDWTTLCVHPKYGTPAADLWGETMWDLYFSKHVNASTIMFV